MKNYWLNNRNCPQDDMATLNDIVLRKRYDNFYRDEEMFNKIASEIFEDICKEIDLEILEDIKRSLDEPQ